MVKGDRVRVTGGPHEGQQGVVFWCGPSKFGPGTRLGVKSDSGDKLWLDEGEVQLALGGAPALYGFDPEDWHDERFELEVRFAKTPDDDELRRLGERWGRCPLSRAGSGWGFSGAFALLSVEPSSGREREVLSEAEGLVLSVHEIVPVVEAVFVGAAQDLPALEPGPDIPGSPRPVDPQLPPLEGRQAFDEALRAVVAAKASQKVDELLARAAEQPIGLRPTEPAAAPGAADYPPWARSWIGSDGEATLGGPLAAPLLRFAGFDKGPLLVEGYELPEGLVHHRYRPLALRGDRALVAACDVGPAGLGTDPDAAPELCLLANGETRPLWRASRHDGGILGVGWIDDSHAAVLTGKRTLVLSVDDGEVLCAVDGSGSALWVVGRLIVASREGVVLFAWLGGKLCRAGWHRHADLRLHGAAEELLLTLATDPPRFFALDGVDQALAALAPTPKEQRKKKQTKKRRSAKPTLEDLPFEELAPEPTVALARAEDRARIEQAGHPIGADGGYRQGVQWTARAGGLSVAIVEEGLALLDEESAVVSVARWPAAHRFELRSPRPLPDGSRAFASHINTIVEAAPGDESAAQVLVSSSLPTSGALLEFVPLGADELVVLLAKALVRLERRDGAWTAVDTAKLVKPTTMIVDIERRQVLVGAEGKTRAYLFDVDKLRKRAAFTEDADMLRLGPDGWQLADSRRKMAHKVVWP